MGKLLPVLALGEVLIAKPAALVAHVPASVCALEDLRPWCSGRGRSSRAFAITSRRVCHGPVSSVRSLLRSISGIGLHAP
jgi:hypothetical protein